MKNTKNSVNTKYSLKKMSKTQKIVLILLLLLLTFFSFPIVLILFIGMLPTITIMITDKKNYDKQMIVGCFNIAGVFFYLFSILSNFALPSSISIVEDIFHLILMLASAGIGLVLYNEIPNLYVTFMLHSHQKQVEKINERLAKLSEEWGTNLSQNK